MIKHLRFAMILNVLMEYGHTAYNRSVYAAPPSSRLGGAPRACLRTMNSWVISIYNKKKDFWTVENKAHVRNKSKYMRLARATPDV